MAAGGAAAHYRPQWGGGAPGHRSANADASSTDVVKTATDCSQGDVVPISGETNRETELNTSTGRGRTRCRVCPSATSSQPAHVGHAPISDEINRETELQ